MKLYQGGYEKSLQEAKPNISDTNKDMATFESRHEESSTFSGSTRP